jgi:hypothetical protein
MLHFDYSWDLSPDKILLDEELNTDRLGWRAGDMFKFVNVNGRQMLIKMDPVEQFARGYKVNENSNME